MKQITNISLDISIPQLLVVHEKQGDSNRWIYATLYDKGNEYSIPANTYGIVRIKKPDGTACVYDSDEHSSAVIISGSTVQVKLIDQALTAAGKAVCSVGLYNSSSEKITAFNFSLDIERDAIEDATIISTDYYNILSQQIARAIQADEDFAGTTASATALPSTSNPTVTFSGGSGTHYNFTFGIPRGQAGLGTNFLTYLNKTSSAFTLESSPTHPDYPYRASVPTGSLTEAGMTALVFFSDAQIDRLHFCAVADTYNGGVYIYSSYAEPAITVPQILIIDARVGT